MAAMILRAAAVGEDGRAGEKGAFAVCGGALARKLPQLAGMWRHWEISKGKSFGENVAFRAAAPW